MATVEFNAAAPTAARPMPWETFSQKEWGKRDLEQL